MFISLRNIHVVVYFAYGRGEYLTPIIATDHPMRGGSSLCRVTADRISEFTRKILICQKQKYML